MCCAPRAFHGPGIQNFDLSVFKHFAISESWRVEFRTEFFNAFLDPVTYRGKWTGMEEQAGVARGKTRRCLSADP